MGKRVYVVSVVCKGPRGNAKGIAIVARRAFQNHLAKSENPIESVKFNGEPKSNTFSLKVGIDDKSLTDYLRKVITKSGQMPSTADQFRIQSILAVEDGQSIKLNEKVRSLEETLTSAQKKVETLEDEKVRLEKRLEISQKGVISPVEGILSYFSTLRFESQSQFAEPIDVGFVRKVFNSELENIFEVYVNFLTGKEFSTEKLNELLTYFPNEVEQELEEEEEKFSEAKEELKFLENLNSGKENIPKSLISQYRAIITSKHHEDTITQYELKKQNLDKTKSLAQEIKDLKIEYDSFADMIDLLKESGEIIPVLFDSQGPNLQIYFPFQARTTQVGFIEDLKKDIESYFFGTEISYVANGSLMYEVKVNKRQKHDGINKLIRDVPFALKITGYNKIQAFKFE